MFVSAVGAKSAENGNALASLLRWQILTAKKAIIEKYGSSVAFLVEVETGAEQP
jgi:hypothetical protein